MNIVPGPSVDPETSSAPLPGDVGYDSASLRFYPLALQVIEEPEGGPGGVTRSQALSISYDPEFTKSAVIPSSLNT